MFILCFKLKKKKFHNPPLFYLTIHCTERERINKDEIANALTACGRLKKSYIMHDTIKEKIYLKKKRGGEKNWCVC